MHLLCSFPSVLELFQVLDSLYFSPVRWYLPALFQSAMDLVGYSKTVHQFVVLAFGCFLFVFLSWPSPTYFSEFYKCFLNSRIMPSRTSLGFQLSLVMPLSHKKNVSSRTQRVLRMFFKFTYNSFAILVLHKNESNHFLWIPGNLGNIFQIRAHLA